MGDAWYQTDGAGAPRLGRAARRPAVRRGHPPGGRLGRRRRGRPARGRLHAVRGRRHRARRPGRGGAGHRRRRQPADLAVDPAGHRGGRPKQTYFHDFFNYAGLHRSVWLYSTPPAHVRDVTVVTGLDGTTGTVDYRVDAGDGDVRVVLLDAGGRRGRLAATGADRRADRRRRAPVAARGGLPLRPARRAASTATSVVDSYTLPVGVRTVEVRGTQFLINGEPFHFTGFGKHEDAAGPRQGPRRRADGPRLRADGVARRQLVPDVALPLRRGGAGLRRPARHRRHRRDGRGRAEPRHDGRDPAPRVPADLLAGDHRRRQPGGARAGDPRARRAGQEPPERRAVEHRQRAGVRHRRRRWPTSSR